MDIFNCYKPAFKEKTLKVELDAYDVKKLLYSLKRDPQKSDFTKALIKNLEVHLKMLEDFKFGHKK